MSRIIVETMLLAVIPSAARDPQFNGCSTRPAGIEAEIASRSYYVYILASRSRNLYVGVTGNLVRRLAEHRAGSCQYTARYRINRLVYVETTDDVRAAIRREKELKAWSRAKRVALIESANPAWNEWPI